MSQEHKTTSNIGCSIVSRRRLRRFVSLSMILLVSKIVFDLPLSVHSAEPSDAEAQLSLASSKTSQCLSTITACGCTITHSGFYEVTGNVGAAGSMLNADGSCIAVKAARSVVFLAGFSITGPGVAPGSGTGIGIHLFRNASGSVVEGIVKCSLGVTCSQTVGSTIVGWNIGIEDDASNVVVDNCVTNGNVTAGLMVKNASGVTVDKITSNNNTRYGVWLATTSSSEVIGGTADSNGTSGIFLGCNTKNPGACQKVNATGRGNRIYENTTDNNLGSGIEIQRNAQNSIVAGNMSTSNTMEDLQDHNNDCDSNLWFGNNANTKIPTPCVH